MSHEPASDNPFASLSLSQMIALNLTRLYTWLIQMNAAGQPHAPRDIAQMVASTDALVHAFVRSRAMAQLVAAGYFDAARAMRMPPSMRASPLEMPKIAITPTEVEQVTIEHLLQRIEDIIDQFEQAEVIAGTLARVIVCALLYVSPETRNAPVYARTMASQTIRRRRVGLGPASSIPFGRGPPSCLDPGSTPGTAGDVRHSPINSFPGARPRVRKPVSQHNRSQFGASEPDRATDECPPHRSRERSEPA